MTKLLTVYYPPKSPDAWSELITEPKNSVMTLFALEIGEEIFGNMQIGREQYVDAIKYLVDSGIVNIEIEEKGEDYRVKVRIWSYLSNCYKYFVDFAEFETSIVEESLERIFSVN